MAPLHVAILKADTPIPSVNGKYRGYGGLYETWLRAAQKKSHNSAELEFTEWDVVDDQAYPDLADVDVIVITGSSMIVGPFTSLRVLKSCPYAISTMMYFGAKYYGSPEYNSFDNDPWILRLVEYTKSVLGQSRVRIVGVCFGHQIIGRAMDVKVSRGDTGWEASVLDIDLTEAGKKIFGKDRLALHQMHKDIVHTYPPSVIPLGSSPKCQVQGMYVPSKLITLQAHPEFNEDIVSQILEARHSPGIFDDETFNDAMRRVGNAHDGILVGAAFLDFMIETRRTG